MDHFKWAFKLKFQLTTDDLGFNSATALLHPHLRGQTEAVH